MKRLFILIFLSICINSFAQKSKTNLKDALSIYAKELQLKSKESKKLNKIYNNHFEKLNEVNIKANDYNAILKELTLEVYNLLTEEQYKLYLELRSIHQPKLRFRFK